MYFSCFYNVDYSQSCTCLYILLLVVEQDNVFQDPVNQQDTDESQEESGKFTHCVYGHSGAL